MNNVWAIPGGLQTTTGQRAEDHLFRTWWKGGVRTMLRQKRPGSLRTLIRLAKEDALLELRDRAFNRSW